MATDRVCPHCITLYNYLGESDNGEAQYSCTLLTNVHIRHNEGVSASDNANDSTRVHIFDDLVAAQPPDGFVLDRILLANTIGAAINDTPEGEKPFVPADTWNRIDSKNQCWTLRADGYDYFSIGDNRMNGTRLPTEKTLFRIVKVSRMRIGSRRMWHWRIEGK